MDVNGKEVRFVTSSDELKGIELEPFFAELSEATYREPHLLGQPAENLIAQFEAGLSALGVCEGRLVAHTTIWPLIDHDGETWYELGTTWVHPEFRGRNVNKALYRMFLPLHSAKNILATTTNAASLSVGQDRELHFESIPREVLPEAVWRESCCCSGGPRRGGESPRTPYGTG